MSIAIAEAITTLVEAERQFQLSRTEDETFFVEWRLSCRNFLMLNVRLWMSYGGGTSISDRKDNY